MNWETLSDETIVGIPIQDILIGLVIAALIGGPGYLFLGEFDVGTTEAVIMETTDSVPDGETSVPYESLSAVEQEQFRSVQADAYTGDEVTLTTDKSLYQGVEYITLDGEVYDVSLGSTYTLPDLVVVLITCVTAVSLLFGFLFAGLLTFEGATRAISKAIATVSDGINKDTLTTIFKGITAVAILAGIIFGASVAQPLVATQISESEVGDTEPVKFSELSEQEQETFVSLVSGGWTVDTLESGTVIQSDGEHYQITPAFVWSVTLANSLYYAFIGLVAWVTTRLVIFYTLSHEDLIRSPEPTENTTI